MRKVMVFGVFDGLHDGHRAFLREAKSLGDYLIAVVAPDRIVEELKRRRPSHALEERIEKLGEENIVEEVVEGDRATGSWRVVGKYRPDVIALGYDQGALKEELERYLEQMHFAVQIKVMQSHKPHQFHNSFRRE